MKKIAFFLAVVMMASCMIVVPTAAADVLAGDLKDSAAMYLSFDGDTNDATGNYTTTVAGTAEFEDGLFGKALHVTSEDNCVQVPDLKFGEKSFSVSFWAKVSDTESRSVFFSNKQAEGAKNNDPGNYYDAFHSRCWGVSLVLDYSNGIIDSAIGHSGDYWYMSEDDGANTGTSQAPVYDAWEHFVYVVDRETGDITLYRNGEHEKTMTGTKSTLVYNPTQQFNGLFVIGNDGQFNEADGDDLLIDEFMVFKSALTADDAAALYACAPAKDEPTPYDDAIEYLQAVGIFKGKEDGLLHAADNVKRYEMALLAARIATGWLDDDSWVKGNTNDTAFTDLQGDVEEKYLGALSYASQMGLIEGYGDGTFKPYDGISYRDVLTIACRLIGYKNLKYPWGFIEKAVNLGLTAGIEDVSYTEPLTRGGVAQVLYNALFTEVNNTTLAAELFGVELAWADIMVTVNDRYVLAGTYGQKDGENLPSAGKVGYQIIDGNGLLPKVKFVNAADFGLEIGQFYRALFSQEIGGGDYTLVKAEPYGVVGSGDNKGIVDGGNVSTVASGAIVLAYNDKGEFTIPGGGNHKYAYDYLTGHVWELTEGGALKGIKFYYSSDLDMYFELKVVDAENPTVIYKPVDDVDLIDYLKDQFYDTKVTGGIGTGKITDTAYSHVDVVNAPNGKKVAYFEEYQLGVYSEGSKKCNENSCACTEDKSATVYSFSHLSLGTVDNDDLNVSNLCGGCGKCVGYKVIGDVEDGDIVIYGVNDITKEIKIIEVVDEYDGSDDTYTAKGIVRGFRMTKGYITIGDENFYYNYEKLAGNAIQIGTDWSKNEADVAGYTAYFQSLVNQYVEYVVVDGKLVNIEVLNAYSSGSNKYIIVDSYVGFSNEGYIVVGGYSTAANNLTYDYFQIAAYDQNKLGDHFWYPNNASLKDAFKRGTVYEITSYDPEEDAYYVKTSALAGATAQKIDATNANRYHDGKIYVNGTMTDNTTMKVVVIDIADNATQYDKPIHVYDGKIPAGWYIDGTAIVSGSTYIFITAKNDIVGFNDNADDFTLAVVLDKNIIDMVYDGADSDWYVQGAMEYKLEVFDLYTATFRTVTGGYNFQPVVNAIYPVIDGKIINAVAQSWNVFDNYYTDANVASATYYIMNKTYAEVTAVTDGISFYDAFVSSNVNGYKYNYDLVKESDKVTYYYVNLDANGNLVDIAGTNYPIAKFDAKYIAGLVPSTVSADVIYDGDSFIVYVYNDGEEPHTHDWKETTIVEVVSTDTVKDAGKPLTIDVITGKNVGTIEGKIVAEIAWSGTHVVTTTKTKWICDCNEGKTEVKWVENAPVTSEKWNNVTVDSVTFKFVGLDGVEHAIIADKAYYFTVNEHALNEYVASVDGKTIASGLYAGEYTGENGCDVEGCDLVNALKYTNINVKLGADGVASDKIEFQFEQSHMEKVTGKDKWGHTFEKDEKVVDREFYADIIVAFDADDGLEAQITGQPRFKSISIELAH